MKLRWKIIIGVSLLVFLVSLWIGYLQYCQTGHFWLVGCDSVPGGDMLCADSDGNMHQYYHHSNY